MAGYANVPVEEYREYEAGKRDFSFTFLYLIAKHTRTDLTELLTGEAPALHPVRHPQGRGPAPGATFRLQIPESGLSD